MRTQTEPPNNSDPFITTRQASDLSGLPLAPLQRWASDGTIPAIKVGGRLYVRESVVRRLMKAGAPKAGPNAKRPQHRRRTAG